MRPSAITRLLAWIALLAALLAASFTRLEMSYDLGLFLPGPRTAEQRILVERLGASPGSRFVLVAVPDEPDRVTALAEALTQVSGVERVLSDLLPPTGKPPEPLWSYRYLLADMDWSEDGLAAALDARLAELGLGTEADYEDLVAHDPALVSLDLLEALAPATDRPWTTDDGRRVLVAVTRAPAFELQAQGTAIAGIRAAVAEAFPPPADTTLSGAGVFGVELQETIRAEATWRSLLASAAIVLVLLLVYRRFSVLLLAALPLLAGLVTGAAAVALAWGQVHGITLAFGFTLLGIAIDYPLHFLSRARGEPSASALRATWPTLRLSALSTALAYAALMAGGATGMAQLGLFSAAGVLGAAATTRWVLPWLMKGRPGPTGHGPGSDPRLRFGVVWVAAGAALVLTLLPGRGPWWESDLAALSPIPAERLALEGQLRAATGAPNIRYQVALETSPAAHPPSEVAEPGAVVDEDLPQSLLEQSRGLQGVLEEARTQGLIDGFSDLTTLLPPAGEQRDRQGGIPANEDLADRLETATAAGPFAVEAFRGFLDDAGASRDLEPLQPGGYAGTALEGALGQHLYRAKDGRWVALATLRGEPDVAALEALLAERMPAARLVDLRAASEALVTDYRERTAMVLGGVVVLLALLLAWRVRPRRAAWTLALVLATVALAAGILRQALGPLDLYHLTGLLLVAGIGLDYALFLGKPDREGSLHAVFACMASTVAAFGVLAASSIPALQSLGGAVALGSALCFLTAWLGSRPG